MKKGVKSRVCWTVSQFTPVAMSPICGFDPHVRVLTVLAAVETRNHGAMATLAITTHLISSAYRTGRAFSETPRSVLALERAHASPLSPDKSEDVFSPCLILFILRQAVPHHPAHNQGVSGGGKHTQYAVVNIAALFIHERLRPFHAPQEISLQLVKAHLRESIALIADHPAPPPSPSSSIVGNTIFSSYSHIARLLFRFTIARPLSLSGGNPLLPSGEEGFTPPLKGDALLPLCHIHKISYLRSGKHFLPLLFFATSQKSFKSTCYEVANPFLPLLATLPLLLLPLLATSLCHFSRPFFTGSGSGRIEVERSLFRRIVVLARHQINGLPPRLVRRLPEFQPTLEQRPLNGVVKQSS